MSPPTMSLTRAPPRFTLQGSALVLVVAEGPDEGKRVEVGEDPIFVGCTDACDLMLADPTVSRRHLRAVRRGRVLELEDLESKNGSFVGGKRFHQIEVAAGDALVVGKTALKIMPAEEAVDPEPAQAPALGGLAGTSPVMRKLFALIERVAPTRAAVLIEGETGTGKELVAEEIHRRSPRREQRFSIFDCGAVPDELIESTLFGHVKGAFTGAASDKIGVLEEADGGTVFLDEIGELDPKLQPALLRVLDRGMIRPVGATRYREIDVRVVAATHRNLGERIEDGSFREDLYYRLAVVRLSVPPLRDRLEDVPLLIRHFLGRLGRPDVAVGDEVLEAVRAHTWPGNVRELRNVVERGLALSNGALDLDAIRESGGLARPGSRAPAPAAPCAASPRRAFRDAKAEAIESFERSYLSELVASFDSLSAAADAAEMDRKHLRTLLRRHGIDAF